MTDDQTEAYFACIETLERVWTPEAIKRQLLLEQRRRAEKCKQRITEYELKNADARKNGESYQTRQQYVRAINSYRSLFQEAVQKGLGFKKREHRLTDWVKPGDEDFIHNRGFEAFLKCATM